MKEGREKERDYHPHLHTLSPSTLIINNYHSLHPYLLPLHRCPSYANLILNISTLLSNTIATIRPIAHPLPKPMKIHIMDENRTKRKCFNMRLFDSNLVNNDGVEHQGIRGLVGVGTLLVHQNMRQFLGLGRVMTGIGRKGREEGGVVLARHKSGVGACRGVKDKWNVHKAVKGGE